MDISRFEVFLNAVECGSFSRVAMQMGYTQSGVSHMMKGLETELGFPLFIRTKDGVVPTQDAENIMPNIRALVNANSNLEETVSNITGLKHGMLRIGAYTSITIMILLPILQKFHKDFSHIHYDIIEGTTNDLSKKLNENQIDIGFFSKQACNDQLKYYPIMEDEFMAIAPKQFAVAQKKYFDLKTDVEDNHLLIPNIDGEYETVEIVRDAGITFDDTFSTNDTYATMSMVEKGLGISLVSKLVLQSHPVNVAALPLEKPKYRTLGMFVPSTISPSTRKFVSYCKQMMPSIIADLNHPPHFGY